MGRESSTANRVADIDPALLDLTVATEADVPAIAALMNLAFRGSEPDAGWTTEADHFQGNRTSEALLRKDIAANADAAMLVWRSPECGLLGCVWLEPEDEDIWYLGSRGGKREEAAGAAAHGQRRRRRRSNRQGHHLYSDDPQRPGARS
jgi:hypothetical protein